MLGPSRRREALFSVFALGSLLLLLLLLTTAAVPVQGEGADVGLSGEARPASPSGGSAGESLTLARAAHAAWLADEERNSKLDHAQRHASLLLAGQHVAQALQILAPPLASDDASAAVDGESAGFVTTGKGGPSVPGPDGGEISEERAEAFYQAGLLHMEGLVLARGQSPGPDHDGLVRQQQPVLRDGESARVGDYAVFLADKIDLHAATRWFNQSAILGHPGAQRELAFLYGRPGVTQNLAASVLYATLAARAGDAQAAQMLGWRYQFGRGVAKSCEWAARYYQIAAASSIDATRGSGVNLLHDVARIGGKSPALSGASRADAVEARIKDEADLVEYFTYNAMAGDTNAQVTVGYWHLYGQYGNEINMPEAVRFFRMAVEQDFAGGLNALGRCYKQGWGVERDLEQARSLLQRAADAGNPAGQASLAGLLLDEAREFERAIEELENVEEADVSVNDEFAHDAELEALEEKRDAAYSEALSLLRKSQSNSPEAAVQLGVLHATADAGVRYDPVKAAQLFGAASQRGDLVAVFNLAQMTHLGVGVQRSCTTALDLYKKVAERHQNHMVGISKRAHGLFAAHGGSAAADIMQDAPHSMNPGRASDSDPSIWDTLVGFLFGGSDLYDAASDGSQPVLSLDIQRASLAYERLAALGSERGQSNAAWLFDHGFGDPSATDSMPVDLSATASAPAKDDGHGEASSQAQVWARLPYRTRQHAVAFEYYRNSADQGSGASHVRLGDFWAYRLGLLSPIAVQVQISGDAPVQEFVHDETQVQRSRRMRRAYHHYEQAADQRHPQAEFNIGWVHQYDRDTTEIPDLHLAKRHYDLALAIEPDAWLAVNLAKTSLAWEFAKANRWRELYDWFSGLEEARAGTQNLPAAEKAKLAAKEAYSWFAQPFNAIAKYQWDTLAVVFLSVLLLFFVLLKRVLQRER